MVEVDIGDQISDISLHIETILSPSYCIGNWWRLLPAVWLNFSKLYNIVQMKIFIGNYKCWPLSCL